MDIKRAIWLSILVYLVSFLFGLITAFAFGLDFESAINPPVAVWIVGIIATIAITALFTVWYFKDKKIKPSAKEGLFFGLTAVVVGIIIDILLLIPVILTGTAGNLVSYYANPFFWVTIALILATAALVGQFRQKKK